LGLAVLNHLLRQAGFGEVGGRDSAIAGHFERVRLAFDGVVRSVNPRFRFVLIEDGTINGIAYPDIWRSYAGLTVGCITMLQKLFGVLMRSNHLMPGLSEPDASIELTPHIKATFEICVAGFDKVVVGDNYFEFMQGAASNPKRVELAYRLFKNALLFLCYHELAHLCRGHGKLLKAVGGSPIILEARGNIPNTKSISSWRQWSELEADWLAAVWCLQDQEWRARDGSKESVLFELFFAVGVVFLIFFQTGARSSFLDDDHPHPYIRLAQLFNNLPTFLVGNDRYPFKEESSIGIAAERVIAEIAIAAKLADFDWFSGAEIDAGNVHSKVDSIRKNVGDEWIARANKAMRRIVKHPPRSVRISPDLVAPDV
jgi:hypothetical protein